MQTHNHIDRIRGEQQFFFLFFFRLINLIFFFWFFLATPHRECTTIHRHTVLFSLNSATASTVIHRPHGDSMLVIRPSVNKKNRPPSSQQHLTKKPVTIDQTAAASTITTTKTTKLPNFSNTALHLETAASTSTGKNCVRCSSFFSFFTFLEAVT